MTLTRLSLRFLVGAATLQSGGNVLSNSRFDGYARVCRTYQPAIAWSGVGNSFSGEAVVPSQPS